jgi:signal peptidase II
LKPSTKVTLLILLVLLLDQAFKFYIKLNFTINDEVEIFGLDWARLHFVENEGMAFGITFDLAYGKLLLSLFRILMVIGLIWYIRMLIRAQVSMGFVYSVGLITAGALGNIIDSAFYGLIFNAPVHEPAQLVPFGQGYATFLHGRVVDMLYFPIKYIDVPMWVPFFGGEQYLFFSPIFNIADSAITAGVLCILLFQRRFFREEIKDDFTQPSKTEAAPALQLFEEMVSADQPELHNEATQATEAEAENTAESRTDTVGKEGIPGEQGKEEA